MPQAAHGWDLLLFRDCQVHTFEMVDGDGRLVKLHTVVTLKCNFDKGL